MNQPTVIVQKSQPQEPVGMQTLQEFWLDPRAEEQTTLLQDGWMPLGIESLEHSLMLTARVTLGAPYEEETFLHVAPGYDLGWYEARNNVDLMFLGRTLRGYLFLAVPRSEEVSSPERKIGRLDLKNPQAPA